MAQSKQRLASKRFGELLSDGFSLFARNYLKIIVPFLLFSIISIVLKTFLLTDLVWEAAVLNARSAEIMERFNEGSTDLSDSEYNTIMQALMFSYLVSLLDSIVDAIFTVMALCSVSVFLYKDLMDKDPDFAEEFKKAFNSKLIPIILILGICTPLGMFLLFIPSIILFIFFIFSVYTYNLEEYESPLRTSRSLMRGSSLKIIGIFFIAAGIWFVIDLVYSSILFFAWPIDAITFTSWYNPETRNYGMIILYIVVYSIPSLILSPLFICLLTPLFAQCKARYELGGEGQYQRIEAMSQYKGYQVPRQPAYQAPQQPAYQTQPRAPLTSQEGMFCPFCGDKISTPKKFCPNCGESLEFE